MESKAVKIRDNGHEAETAKIIAQTLLRTDEDSKQETSYIPLKLVHILSMLQALEGQYAKMLRQIIDIENWRKKQLNPEFVPEETSDEDITKAVRNLFIHKFRNALHQYYRGLEGKFFEHMVILADTDLQTRGSADMDNIFKHNIREQ